MSTTPFQLIWSDYSGNQLSQAGFPVGFPGTVSIAQQIKVTSNAIQLQTFETLVGVKFFLTGDANDINTVQNIWPTLGGLNEPELNGGFDVSFDFGSTYIRFDSTHGLQSDPSTWISLPAEAVGLQGVDETLGAFDTAYLIIRYVIPPQATQFGVLNVNLGMDFDII